jgi:hypothetical protein
VHLSGALNDRAEGTGNGAGEDSGGLDTAGIGTADGAGGLVEPGLHTLIPILAQVDVRDNVVVSHHFLSFTNQQSAIKRQKGPIKSKQAHCQSPPSSVLS